MSVLQSITIALRNHISQKHFSKFDINSGFLRIANDDMNFEEVWKHFLFDMLFSTSSLDIPDSYKHFFIHKRTTF